MPSLVMGACRAGLCTTRSSTHRLSVKPGRQFLGLTSGLAAQQSRRSIKAAGRLVVQANELNHWWVRLGAVLPRLQVLPGQERHHAIPSNTPPTPRLNSGRPSQQAGTSTQPISDAPKLLTAWRTAFGVQG
jgi:hypothetical protein